MLNTRRRIVIHRLLDILFTGHYLESFASKFVSPTLLCLCSIKFSYSLLPDLYYLAFPQDPLRNKLLVYSVFLLEIAQTLLVTDTSFKVFGTGYGNLAIFSDVAAAWFYIPVITGIGELRDYLKNHWSSSSAVAFIAQAFYAYRLRVLSQSRWVALVIIFVSNWLIIMGFFIAHWHSSSWHLSSSEDQLQLELSWNVLGPSLVF